MPPEANTIPREAVQAAVREARRHHLGAWKEALDEHKNHPGFKTRQDVFSRKLGFVCDCTGEEQEWVIDVGHLAQLESEARDQVRRFLEHHRRRGMKAKKRKRRRAEAKAKALLFRHLTKEQKWQLRAKGAFWVEGSDGYEYEITTRSIHSITRYDCEGLAVREFCIVPKYREVGDLPQSDVMLAQKVLIEADLDSFLKIAHSTDLVGRRSFDGALREAVREPVPNNILDNPRHWMLGHMGMPEVLTKDLVYGDALYDVPDGVAWVLDDNLNVLVEFGDRVELPIIHNPRQRFGPNFFRKALCRLLTSVPAPSYDEFAEVGFHFRGHDLGWVFAIAHPNTRFPKHLQGRLRVLEPMLPPGKVYCLASAEFLGIQAFIQETKDQAFGIYNINAICTYETGICPRKGKQPRNPSRPSVRLAKPRNLPPSVRRLFAPPLPLVPRKPRPKRKQSLGLRSSRRRLSYVSTGTLRTETK